MSMTISMTLPSTHIFRFACVITSFVWGSGTIFSASVYELATADVALAKFGFFFHSLVDGCIICNVYLKARYCWRERSIFSKRN